MQARNALTLVEMIIVLSVLAALSGIMVPLCSSQLSSASQTATRATLAEVQHAMQSYWHDTKLVTLDGLASVAIESERFEITWLFRSPVTGDSVSQYSPSLRSGWNGPYLLSSTDETGGNPDLIDAWGNPLVVQYVNPTDSVKDVRFVSSGPNGIIDIPPGTATSALTPGSIGDDLYVALMLR